MDGRLVAAGAFGAVLVLVAAALFANAASAHSGRADAARRATASTPIAGATSQAGGPGAARDANVGSGTDAGTDRANAGTDRASAGTGTGDADDVAVDRLGQLEQQLGDRTSGTYLDAGGRAVVTVTDAAAAELVHQAGAVAKPVSRTRTQLRAAMSTLNTTATVPGTSWAVDPASNRVVIEFDDTVTAAGMQKVRAAAAGLGDTVEMRQMSGRLSARISGGDAIFGQGGRCSLGFAVTVAGRDAFLTAGHCGKAIRSWFTDPQGREFLGSTVRSSFPGDDFALVLVTSTTVPLNGTVRRRDITAAGTPVIGQTVVRRGSTTGTHTGTVTALNATVNFPEGTVTGLIRTTVCAEPGDSGGPLFSGSTALGLTSGGSGDCQRGGVTFYQPVTEPLALFGATVQ